MQRILIGEDCDIYMGEHFVQILNKAYGFKTNDEWYSTWIKDMDNFILTCRTDDLVLQAVEDLQFKTSDYVTTYKYKIIEIPDDVEWYVRSEECSNGEYISEKHRTWY